MTEAIASARRSALSHPVSDPERPQPGRSIRMTVFCSATVSIQGAMFGCPQ